MLSSTVTISQCGVPPFLGPRKTASDHLHIEHRAQNRPRNQDEVRLRCIESRRQYTVIANDTQLTGSEFPREVLTGESTGLATHRRCRNIPQGAVAQQDTGHVRPNWQRAVLSWRSSAGLHALSRRLRSASSPMRSVTLSGSSPKVSTCCSFARCEFHAAIITKRSVVAVSQHAHGRQGLVQFGLVGRGTSACRTVPRDVRTPRRCNHARELRRARARVLRASRDRSLPT